jgi:raffinose/stachyose/melibiose transport system permease protein
MSSITVSRSDSFNRAARLRRGISSSVFYVILSVIAAAWIYPFLWIVSTALKTNNDIFGNPSLIPHPVVWSNFPAAWTTGHFGDYFFNTVVVASCAVIAVLALSSTAGFALSRRGLVGKMIVIGALLATLLIPQSFTVIPVFDLIRKIHLLNTIWGVVLGEVGGAQVLYILLFMGFFQQLPSELEDSGKIDGCGFYRVFWSIALPMTRPVIATVIIFQFLASWNDFLLPLVLTLGNQASRTLGVGMYAFVGDHQVDWAGMAAGGTIALVPIMIVFVVMQNQFVNGIAGAIKG